nr:immunoglobulin heavy chain junction region [Macaca mulatta]MOV55155.1 immunoglobulin heavy chain junction region [Macaca mulatta]MOV55728.1 immunoglobulin heavy chain junction region [Macaca mulatta]MOV55930.1 immunoglobulin heavy chain junction region [Macaca mulatta]MOV58168.1 immunoglobulin heavy chain junction region [Macaca mulatta]
CTRSPGVVPPSGNSLDVW